MAHSVFYGYARQGVSMRVPAGVRVWARQKVFLEKNLGLPELCGSNGDNSIYLSGGCVVSQ